MTTLSAPANGRRTGTVRVRSLLLGAVVVLAVAGAALGVRWLDGFTPIAVGSSSGAGPHARALEPAIGSGGVSVYTFPYREHATARWLVSLRNTSRFDIRLTGLALPGGRDDGLIRILGLRLPADPRVISWSDTVPFRLITLRAGTELPAIVLLRIGNCRFNGYGGSASIDSLPMRYTLFGVLHRTEQFPAGSAVSVAAPRASACPER